MRIPTISSNSSRSSGPPDLRSLVDAHRIDLKPYEAVRKCLHAHPELSKVESETMLRIGRHLRLIGFTEVHEKIGGTGVAGVFRNGAGPVVFLRSDTDGLPVREQTGLAYASTRTMRDAEGEVQPVMHACGHDVHMTCLLAAAETLVGARACWSGTLEVVFQPAEERLYGAQAMVDDGLFTRYIPVPDVLLGQHVHPQAVGFVGMRKGAQLAASDSFEITFYGRGAHASQPENGVDPVLMAASAVVRLQGIVSREVAARDAAVVTVASIHAGQAENIISDHAVIKVNVRTYDTDVRDRVLRAIRRIIKAEADASGAPREPEMKLLNRGPALVNDEKVWSWVGQAFRDRFGDDYDSDIKAIMGSEDFGVFGAAVEKPSAFWFFGGTDKEEWEKAKREGRLSDIPTNHSPFFAPVMQPTLRNGVDLFVTAALSYLAK